MRRFISIVCIIALIISLALSLSSCSQKKLNGLYQHNNDENKILLSFYSNKIEIGYFEHDPYYDVYRYISFNGKYKIIEDPNNPDSLLIQISIPEREKLVYTFEETETGIIIDGKEFELVESYPNNYWFKKFLFNNGIIDSIS